jgi:hypothetical protein
MLVVLNLTFVAYFHDGTEPDSKQGVWGFCAALGCLSFMAIVIIFDNTFGFTKPDYMAFSFEPQEVRRHSMHIFDYIDQRGESYITGDQFGSHHPASTARSGAPWTPQADGPDDGTNNPIHDDRLRDRGVHVEDNQEGAIPGAGPGEEDGVERTVERLKAMAEARELRENYAKGRLVSEMVSADMLVGLLGEELGMQSATKLARKKIEDCRSTRIKLAQADVCNEHHPSRGLPVLVERSFYNELKTGFEVKVVRSQAEAHQCTSRSMSGSSDTFFVFKELSPATQIAGTEYHRIWLLLDFAGSISESLRRGGDEPPTPEERARAEMIHRKLEPCTGMLADGTPAGAVDATHWASGCKLTIEDHRWEMGDEPGLPSIHGYHRSQWQDKSMLNLWN